MKSFFWLVFLGLFTTCSPRNAAQRPNIIFFLADDLGYGELGILGQEKIKTPHIDALAKSGMLFTQHYSAAPVCAPARYMFLTGQHSGHAYIRGNDEWAERGEVWNYRKAVNNPGLEGQRPIPANTITLVKTLKEAGYQTGLFGKWGLGAPETAGVPTQQGFDVFYGYNCQRQAHNLYPPFLWQNEEREMLNNQLLVPHTRLDSTLDSLDAESYQLYTQEDYAPTKIHEAAMSFLEKQRNQPFFMYYASPLPHLPLQAPKAWVDRYRQAFGEEAPYTGDRGYFPCRYPRATYAAMIAYLDHQLGELIAQLKAQGQYEHTLIFFTSDNGPTYTGGVDFDFFHSSRPFANGYGKTKGFVHEGGIRVPMIASWPGHIEQGSRSAHLSAFYDVFPTICDLLDLPVPVAVDGVSFKATLTGQVQAPRDYLYWEFPSYKGQQAVRMGKWKGIRKQMQEGNREIELYDLELDLTESHNVAKEYPEIVAQMKAIMKAEHVPSLNPKFRIAALDGDIPK